MKYEGQDQQYRKGAWAGDNTEAPTTRQLERKLQRIHNKVSTRQWNHSPYRNEHEREFARATRKDMRLEAQMQRGLNKLELREAQERYKV